MTLVLLSQSKSLCSHCSCWERVSEIVYMCLNSQHVSFVLFCLHHILNISQGVQVLGFSIRLDHRCILRKCTSAPDFQQFQRTNFVNLHFSQCSCIVILKFSVPLISQDYIQISFSKSRDLTKLFGSFATLVKYKVKSDLT